MPKVYYRMNDVFLAQLVANAYCENNKTHIEIIHPNTKKVIKKKTVKKMCLIKALDIGKEMLREIRQSGGVETQKQ